MAEKNRFKYMWLSRMTTWHRQAETGGERAYLPPQRFFTHPGGTGRQQAAATF